MSWPALFARELATLPPPLRELTHEVLRLVPDTADDALLRVAAQEQMERLGDGDRARLRAALDAMRASVAAQAEDFLCVTYEQTDLLMVACEGCGAPIPIQSRGKKRRFCSAACRKRATMRRIREGRRSRSCDQCGSPIVGGSDPRSKRCGEACNARAARIAKNKWRRENGTARGAGEGS